MNRPGDKAKHRSIDDWLGDMHRDFSAIVKNTAAVSEQQFMDDETLQDHVTLRLTNIGEASKYLGQFFPDFQKQITVIPWSKLARTRDVLTHAYFNVDPQLLWQMARVDIPPIKRNLELVISNRRTARGLGRQGGMDRGA